MNNIQTTKRSAVWWTWISCVIFIAITFCVYSVNLQKAHAQFGDFLDFIDGVSGLVVTIEGGQGSEPDILNALTNSLDHALNQSLRDKEILYDPLAFNLSQQALQQYVVDIVTFVNSGMDGDPAFITNFELYFAEGRDQVIGEILYQGELEQICEPFQLEVTQKVAEEVQKKYYSSVGDKVSCTIDEFSEDSKAFRSGKFSEGGFSALFEIGFHPEKNTPIGVAIETSIGINEAVEKREENDRLEAQINKGFLSVKKCEQVETSRGIKEQCFGTSPGSILADQLAFSMQIPALSLIGADEMNEVIGSLFGQLSIEAFTGVNGLLGLGGNEAFADLSFGVDLGLSFLDALRLDNVSSNTNGQTLQQAAEDSELLFDYQLELLARIDAVEQKFTTAKSSSPESCWNLDFSASSLATDQTQLVDEELPDTITAMVTLNAWAEEYNTATSERRTQILSDFGKMLAQGKVPDKAAIIAIETKLSQQIGPVIENFESQIASEKASCS